MAKHHGTLRSVGLSGRQATQEPSARLVREAVDQRLVLGGRNQPSPDSQDLEGGCAAFTANGHRKQNGNSLLEPEVRLSLRVPQEGLLRSEICRRANSHNLTKAACHRISTFLILSVRFLLRHFCMNVPRRRVPRQVALRAFSSASMNLFAVTAARRLSTIRPHR